MRWNMTSPCAVTLFCVVEWLRLNRPARVLNRSLRLLAENLACLVSPVETKLRVMQSLQGMTRPWFTAWPLCWLLFLRFLVVPPPLVLPAVVTWATAILVGRTGLIEWVKFTRIGLCIRL